MAAFFSGSILLYGLEGVDVLDDAHDLVLVLDEVVAVARQLFKLPCRFVPVLFLLGGQLRSADAVFVADQLADVVGHLDRAVDVEVVVVVKILLQVDADAPPLPLQIEIVIAVAADELRRAVGAPDAVRGLAGDQVRHADKGDAQLLRLAVVEQLGQLLLQLRVQRQLVILGGDPSVEKVLARLEDIRRGAKALQVTKAAQILPDGRHQIARRLRGVEVLRPGAVVLDQRQVVFDLFLGADDLADAAFELKLNEAKMLQVADSWQVISVKEIIRLYLEVARALGSTTWKVST